jgi:hypothetical protein
VSSDQQRLTRLEGMVDVVEQIRRANNDGDHRLATRLSERLDKLLAGNPEQLLKTKELADWEFSVKRKREGDALAANALDELRSAVLALGPSPSWH